jgi:DNA-binding winged helix-turn-helix (wHTH) protein
VDGRYSFAQFVLDTADRRLVTGDGAVELNGRYFDALALLVREPGKLISKDRFLAEVWKGVPVTDEALTQCIRTLRRQLGDDAARPQFIETVPKHGYRFIARVDLIGATKAQSDAEAPDPWREFVSTGWAGTLGGAVGGLIGGLIYGFLAASYAQAGALSALLVLLIITMMVAIIAAAGVSFAIATAAFAAARSWQWLVIAGAGGGLITGAVVKLLGLDAFSLLIGHGPQHITGAMEGLLIGGAVGFACCLAPRAASTRRAAAMACGIGGVAGIAVVLLGGHLLLGSLALLTRDFPESHLHVDRIGNLFGETGVGLVTQMVSAALESALFVGSVVAGLDFVGRHVRVKG